jgi:uncharacterized iron-regulated membrane protein
VRNTLRTLHRYVALTCAALWLVQGLTGLLMVFRWELDDAPLAGPAVALDVAALDARISAIEGDGTGRTVTQLWATGGVDGRYDLHVDVAGGHGQVVRVDGAGRVLRTRGAEAGLIPQAATLHQTLFAGDTGRSIIGASGALLVVTVLMGLVLAWPKRVTQWRPAVWPPKTRPGAARRYAWHRAVGLWLAVPVVVFASAGALMTIDAPLKRWFGLDATPPELATAQPLVGPPIGTARALQVALQQVSGAGLSGAAFPKADAPWYRVRVRQPGELRRVYGTTTVYVAAADGRVLRVEDALRATPARAFMDALYPVHTGEAAGPLGRLLSLAFGSWLLTMLVLGIGLWSARRRKLSRSA